VTKRFFDILIAFLALLAFLPVIAVVGLCVRCVQGGDILFRQIRPGLSGVPFVLYKFQTMTQETDGNGELLTDEARLTPLGAFLRRISLDELPQLYNVLKGELSLVGPRPLLMEYLPLYTREQSRRHEVRPGITGWAQVNGRNAIDWDSRLNMDVWYVDHQSFWLDMKILLLTITQVIKGTGVNQPGLATVEKFRGSNH